MTMRSNGSSKTIGAAMAATSALPSRVPMRGEPRVSMTANTATAASRVTGVMGSAGAAPWAGYSFT